MSTQAGIKSSDRRSGQPTTVESIGGGTTHQYISITDILSEGEIEGLVDSGSSIFMNGDPLFDISEVPNANTSGVTATGTSGETTLTLNKAVSQVKSDTSSLYIGITYRSNVRLSNKQYLDSGDTAPIGLKCDFVESSNSILSSMVFDTSTGKPFSFDNLNHGVASMVLTLDSGAILTGFISGLSGSTPEFTDPTVNAVDMFLEDDFVQSPPNQHIADITVWYEVQSISGTTITLASALTRSWDKKKVIISGNFTADNPESKKHPGSKFQFRNGTLIQAPVGLDNNTGSSTVALTVQGGNLVKNTAKTITTNNLTGAQKREIDSVRFTINYGSGLYGYDDSDGDEFQTRAAYRVELGIQRSGQSLTYFKIAGNIGATTSSYLTGNNTDSLLGHWALKKSAISFEHEIDLTPYQPFEDFAIRITRLTNHGTIDDGVDYQRPHRYDLRPETKSKYKLVGTSAIFTAIGVIEEKLNFPYTALASISFNSKNFPNVPKRTYELKGLKIQVPSNYITRDEYRNTSTVSGAVEAVYQRNLTTGADAGSEQAWDGNFRDEKVYCNNPAWVFYDILTNNRYGLGSWLTSLDIDKYSLYKIGRYCDELVPDGKGGQEPRFTANLYLTKATDAYKVLKDMATIFRGMLYWLNGTIVPIIDEKKEPVYNFSKSNVVDGQFTYESTGSKTRANQYIVTWNNPESQYKLEPIILEDRDNIIRTGKIIKETAVAFGCTSEGQALRYGRWKLWTAINQTEVASFRTGINASFLSPGDIINITDDSDYNIPFSGRVNSYTETGGNLLTLDRDIDAHLSTSGYTYTLSLIVPKDTAVLNQASATINSSSYSRGDIVTTARIVHNGSQVTLINASDAAQTELNLVSALDDSNEHINLLRNTSTIVQERTLTGSTTVNGVGCTVPSAAAEGRTTLSLTAALDEVSAADLKESIWAIKQTDTGAGALTLSSPKEYKILGIVQEDNGVFAISAVEHYNEKFDDIENDFNLAVDDPVTPPEPDTAPPVPPGLRILRVPDRRKAGEEILIEWDEPANYDYLAGYELRHNLSEESEFEDVFIPVTGSRSRKFTGIADGVYEIYVRSISNFNKRSKPAETKLKVTDYFGGGVRTRGVLIGALCSQALEVNTTTGAVSFAADYNISPPEGSSTEDDTAAFKSNNTSNASSRTHTVTGLASGSWPGWKNASNVRGAKLLYDYSNADHASNDPIRLVAWKRDDDLNVEYFYDADKYIANAASIWTNLSGTVAVAANSNKVVGSGTSFNSLDITRILKFSSTKAARIAYIENDTTLYIDKVFDSAVSAGTTAAADELAIDYLQDFFIADVTYNPANSKYAMKSHVTQTDSLIGLSGKTVVLTSDDFSIIYDEEGGSPVYTSSGSSRIILTATPYNFTDPLFRFTFAGTAGNWVDTTNTDAATYTFYEPGGSTPSIPATYNKADWPKVVKVEAGEKPAGWSSGAPDEVSAIDSVSLIGVKVGSGGVALSNPNSAHTYSVPAGGAATGVSIEGTTLELIVGGVVYDYIGKTSGWSSGDPLASGQSLDNKEWYISGIAITTGGSGNLTLGTPTSEANDIVTIGNHTGVSGTPSVVVVTYTITYKQAGVQKTIKTTQSLTKSITGDTGVGTNGLDGTNVTLTPSSPAVTYTYDGTNWDASVASVTITVTPDGVTNPSYSWSGAGTDTGGAVRTISFTSNLAEGNIPAAQTVSVTVSGKKSDGTTDFSQAHSMTIPVAKAHKGTDGTPGGPGFFFLKRTGLNESTGTPGQELGEPSSSEIASPAEGHIAIVENGASPPAQKAYRHDGTNWGSSGTFIFADIISANAIGASQLAISNASAGSAGIYMNTNNGNPKIEIRDANNPRVTLGYLG